MIRKLVSTALLLLIALTASAGHIIINASKTYVRRLVLTDNTITTLRTQSFIDIEYTPASKQEIILYAPQNVADYVKVTVSGNVLTADFKNDITIQNCGEIKVLVRGPKVNDFRTNSSGDITIMGNLDYSGSKTPVYLTTNSSGDIKALDITSPSIELKTRSSGNIKVANLTCSALNATTYSSGDVDIKSAVAVKSAVLTTMSSGNVDIDELTAGGGATLHTTSSGDVSAGAVSATTLDVVTSSSGDINAANIEASSVSAKCGSSGNITLKGICTTAGLTVSSSSEINASGLAAEDVTTVITSSSGYISCHALNSLETRGGKVRYRGNPATIKSSSTELVKF